MKMYLALKLSALRLPKIWKGVLIIWFSSLLLVSLVAIPVKGALRSGFGSSMITEKLMNGIDVEVFADMGPAFRNLLSYFSTGMVMLVVISFLFNAFLSGGLFNCLKGSSGKFDAAEFFRISAKKFWPFLVISLVTGITILFLAVIIVALPVLIVSQSETSAEGSVIVTAKIAVSVFFLLVTIILLIADYARAWQASNERNEGFKALGFGFSETFRTFSLSYSLMLAVLIIQFLYGWLVLIILPGLKPVSGSGIMLLSFLSQILFFIKIMLKAWRYGGVTSLMAQNAGNNNNYQQS